ncbi:hypothetical protein DEA98_25245 [Brucella pseudogrignonensis]|nr:hypothetical protein A8A54_22505 [Brucella pseudogrignonensis]MCM0753175.1 hypothetical protein [Brucella pseudogrignonensis]PQZ39337.1 hypothetical protein CQ059_22305 [Brucella pseudogrignonensis]PRA41160.1 hypothetical protein CQ063_11730 [Brucella pseudogrignonensis]PRA69986.1 hypothetical protein CQ055_11615 [Brucella pseudogrignonensis]
MPVNWSGFQTGLRANSLKRNFERQSGSAAIVKTRNKNSPKSQRFIFALPQPAHDPDRQPRDQSRSFPMSCTLQADAGGTKLLRIG